MKNKQKAKEVSERLVKYPKILKKIEATLDIMEDKAGKYNLADDAEFALIPEVKGIGTDLLEAWSCKKEENEVSKDENLKFHSKKNSIGTQHSETSK